jgi:hypothetical protein
LVNECNKWNYVFSNLYWQFMQRRVA